VVVCFVDIDGNINNHSLSLILITSNIVNKHCIKKCWNIDFNLL